MKKILLSLLCLIVLLGFISCANKGQDDSGSQDNPDNQKENENQEQEDTGDKDPNTYEINADKEWVINQYNTHISASYSKEIKSKSLDENSNLIVEFTDGTMINEGYAGKDSSKYDSDYDGITNDLDAEPLNNHYTVNSSITMNSKTSSIDMEFNVDYRDFILDDNTVYNSNIAKLSLVLSTFIFDLFKMKIDDKTISCEEFFNLIGCTDYELIDLSEESYSVDENDVGVIAIAHHKVSYQGTEKEVVFIVGRGTSNVAEWLSNFDIGNSTNYLEMTGEHPQWENKENVKGFDVAYERFSEKIKEYFDKYLSSSTETIVSISGFSRGAALAALIGAEFDQNPNYKSFAYCFASPNVTLSDETYPSVFTIINENDVVGVLPMSSLGFKKIGTVLSASYDEYQEVWAKLMNGATYTAVDTKVVDEKLSSLIESLTDLYEIKKDEDSTLFPNYKKEYDTEEEANQVLTKMKNIIKKYNGLDYVSMEVIQKDGKYVIEAYMAPALFSNFLACAVSNYTDQTALMSYILEGLDVFSEKYLNVLSDISSSFTGLFSGHVPSAYYVILEYFDTKNN